MPRIKSKVIRVKDPDGIWHDLPAVVSEEAMAAAERANNSEQIARSCVTSAQAAANDAETAASEAEDAAATAKGWIPETVYAWLDAHPDQKIEVEELGFVTPEMFGAIGNGVANDYQAFADCAAYANENGFEIHVPNKSYYINGDNTIDLNANVECDNSVFIVGDRHFKMIRPVFQYNHDQETQATNTLLSDVIVDNNTVTQDYANKFFVLDTKIAYGTPNAQEAPSDETIKETIFTNGTKTTVFFDDVSTHLSKSVDITNISDIDETGYRFSGAVVRQKTENSYGITFMKIRRNNMTVEDIQIECNNTGAENAVFYNEFCNAVTYKNVKSYSRQPQIWGYETSFHYCANVLVDNYKGYNAWSTIATRGLKNYALMNSITNSFDVHWNAFGRFLCQNCTLYDSPHVGYGKGDFIVKDTTAKTVGIRHDYPQIWCGSYVVENVSTDGGFIMEMLDTNSATGYDPFFNTIELPELTFKNFKSRARNFYFKIPNAVASRIEDRSAKITIEGVRFADVDVATTNRKYNIYLYNCDGSTSDIALLRNIGYFVCGYPNESDLSSEANVSSTYFANGGTFVINKQGNIVCLSFSGVNSASINAWTAFANIKQKIRPLNNLKTMMCVGTDAVCPITLYAGGTIGTDAAVAGSGKRCSFSITYMVADAF